MISVGVKLARDSKPVTNYSVNIGGIGIYEPQDQRGQIPVPRNFRLESSQVNGDATAAELRLLWDFSPQVWYYDITRTIPGGTPLWLGRISADAYYMQALPRIGKETHAMIRLRAVGKDPNVASTASLKFTW